MCDQINIFHKKIFQSIMIISSSLPILRHDQHRLGQTGTRGQIDQSLTLLNSVIFLVNGPTQAPFYFYSFRQNFYRTKL